MLRSSMVRALQVTAVARSTAVERLIMLLFLRRRFRTGRCTAAYCGREIPAPCWYPKYRLCSPKAQYLGRRLAPFKAESERVQWTLSSRSVKERDRGLVQDCGRGRQLYFAPLYYGAKRT